MEIEPPTRADRDSEIGLAFKNAVHEIADKNNPLVLTDSDDNMKEKIDTAYEMLAAIRTAKGLGTAILKVIIQEIVSARGSVLYITEDGSEIENNLDIVLDWSLTANFLPQLQGVNKKTLDIFEKIFIKNTGSPIDLFKEVIEDETKIDEYKEGWKMFVKFVRNTDNVSAEELDLKIQRTQIGVFDDAWQTRMSQITFDPSKGEFATKLRELIENEDF